MKYSTDYHTTAELAAETTNWQSTLQQHKNTECSFICQSNHSPWA